MYTVDASVWVNAFDQREPGHAVSRQLLDLVRRRSLPIVLPTQDPGKANANVDT